MPHRFNAKRYTVLSVVLSRNVLDSDAVPGNQTGPKNTIAEDPGTCEWALNHFAVAIRPDLATSHVEALEVNPHRNRVRRT